VRRPAPSAVITNRGCSANAGVEPLVVGDRVLHELQRQRALAEADRLWRFRGAAPRFPVVSVPILEQLAAARVHRVELVGHAAKASEPGVGHRFPVGLVLGQCDPAAGVEPLLVRRVAALAIDEVLFKQRRILRVGASQGAIAVRGERFDPGPIRRFARGQLARVENVGFGSRALFEFLGRGDVGVAAAHNLVGATLLRGLGVGEGFMLVATRGKDLTANLIERIERRPPTARYEHGRENAARDETRDRTANKAVQTQSAGEATDDRYDRRGEQEPPDPLAAFQKQRRDLLVLQREHLVPQIGHRGLQALLGRRRRRPRGGRGHGVIRQLVRRRRAQGRSLTRGGDEVPHFEQRLRVALETVDLPAPRGDPLLRLVEQLLRLVFLRVEHRHRLPLGVARLLARRGQRRLVPRIGVLANGGADLVRFAAAVFQRLPGHALHLGVFGFERPAPLFEFLGQPIGGGLELQLRVGNLGVERRPQHSLVVGATIRQLLQVLHQFENAASGKAGFGHRRSGFLA
jgi:hypothetical protein